jgi:hypothetical protein
MTVRGWKSKGGKEPRRSPRKTGKTCGRPFKAPRKKGKTTLGADVEDSDVQIVVPDKQGENDSQVQCITETQNQRDMEGKFAADRIKINPYPNGLRRMSEREADETARHGKCYDGAVTKRTRRKTKQKTHLWHQTRQPAHLSV